MLHKIKTKYQQHKLKRAQKREEKRRNRELIHSLPSAFDEAVISWIAPEAIRHERGTLWKIVMSLVVIGTITFGILYNSWTFSLAIAAFVFAYYIVNLEHPKHLEVKISDIGIKIGNRKYPFSRIKAFWTIYEPPYTATLNIRTTGEITSDITIQLHGQSPSEIRRFLLDKIPELEGQSEKLSDIFLRLFKI